MASYLDNLTQYTSKAQVVIAGLALEAANIIDNNGNAFQQVDNVNWYTLLLTGANDTTQSDTLRLELLTLLVDNARLNEEPLVNVFGLYQTLGDSTITASQWGLITGNINDQIDLIAKFNQYLPLTAGVTKPLTGALYFADDELGIDVINEGDTLNIGASAGVVQFGLDAEVKLNVITEGAWQGTNIGVTYGGLGDLDFASGTNGQAIIKSGSGYAFYTIPAIPSLAGYIKADGTVPMTADLRFSPTFGIDTTAAGAIRIGQTNATSARIYPPLTVSTIVAGTWNGSVIGLGYGGTGASLSIPANNSFFIYSDDNTTSEFATIGDNLSYSGGSVALAQTINGSNRWRADVIEVAYGGTGLNAVGAEGDVLTVVSGAPAWTTFTALTNPMDDAGQMIYGGVAGVPTKLEPNATSTNKFLRSVSSGDPSWQILVAGDIPTISQSQVSGLTTALTNKLSTVLTDGYMYIGNAANAAVGVTMYGDATIDNTGSLLIADEAVTFAKMQNITATTLVGRWSAGDGPMQEVTIGSGLSLSITGVLTSGGLVNPMTTIGDMIIGDTGGDPIRLAAGTNGYILTMVSGSPAWAVAASGGGNVVGPGPTVVANNFAVYNGTGGLTIGEPTGASLDGAGNATFLSVRVNGTGGAGHMHFRHQASAVAGMANSNTIYALPVASNGFGFIINNAAYASSLVFGATLARTYTLPDLSGTVALLANPAAFTSVTTGTASSVAGDVIFQNASNANTQTLRGSAVASSIVYVLPTTAPTAGQALVSTAPSSGIATLSWSTVSGSGVNALAAIGSTPNANGATISGTTLNLEPADATNGGVVTFGTQTFGGAKTFNNATTFSLAGATGAAIVLSGTGSRTNPSISFTGGTLRWMSFGNAGLAAPSLANRSDGTKIVLADTFSAGTFADSAMGMTATNMWFGVANNGGTFGFQWYGGATVALTLTGAGTLTLVGAIIGAATQSVFNTVSTNVSAFGAATTLTIGATTGTATIRNATLNINGDLKLPTVGTGIYVKEGTNATMGSATLVGGTVVVSTTKVTANSRIFLTNNVNGGTLGSISVSARTAGTSFTISSTNVLDTSTIAWVIIEPA